MSFFVAGGTIPPGSPSYVERAADRELFEALLGGEFCYVLNSRQIGKSSLAVRTIAKLNDAEVKTAFVDLTRLGATGADPERWYAGLLAEVGRALGLRSEAMAYLKANAALPAVARLFGFLRDVALVDVEGQIVLMIDEIDAVRSLPFPADDLFAGLRELHNARAIDPGLRRLTICLLGAALPSDLIVDPRRTPFNVGRRIELRDFTPEEARPFASQVGEEALSRVLYWTGGHPFLTQAMCAELANSPSPSGSSWRGGRGEREVDALVQSRYLDARARETDTNLTDVARRLLGEGDPNVTDEDRATTLAHYERMLKGKAVADDEANPAAARIKMSGVARFEDGALKIRNRIYADAFNARWIKDNIPGQELRRQRNAFWKGALRTGIVATMVLVVVSTLAILAVRNARRATKAEALARGQRDQARYDAYVASMMSLRSTAFDGDLTKIGKTLLPFQDSPSRGWEWDYWKSYIDKAELTVHLPEGVHFRLAALSHDGRLAALSSASGEIVVARLDRAAPLKSVVRLGGDRLAGTWLIDEGRTLVIALDGQRVQAIDVSKGNVRWTRNLRFEKITLGSGRHIFGTDSKGLFDLDLASGTIDRLGVKPGPLQFLVASPDDRRLLWVGVNDIQESQEPVIYDCRSHRLRSQTNQAARWVVPIWSADGRSVVMPLRHGTGDDWSIDQFDADSGKVVWSKHIASTDVASLAISPDGRRLIVPGYHRKAALYDIEKSRLIYRATLPEIRIARFLPSGRYVTMYADLRVYAHDFPAVKSHVEMGFSPQISPNGRVFGTGSSRSSFVDPVAKKGRSVVHLNFPLTFRYASSNGTAFLQASPDGKEMQVVDSEIGRVRFSIPCGLGDGPRLPARQPFDDLPKDHLVAIAMHDRVEVYDTARHALLKSIQIEPYLVQFSPTGKYLLCVSEAGGMRLFTVADWKGMWGDKSMKGVDRLMNAAFSPDEKTIALASMNEVVSLIDVQNGRQDGEPLVHSVAVTSANWSPDGRRIVTGDFNGLIHLWDRQTRREVTTLDAEGDAIYCLRFIDRGRMLVSINQKGFVRTWSTDSKR